MTRYNPKKDLLLEFNQKYANNDEACEEYFFQIRYPDGYVCEKCGCTHYKKITGRGYCYSCYSTLTIRLHCCYAENAEY